jgi:hypothetical protein
VQRAELGKCKGRGSRHKDPLDECSLRSLGVREQGTCHQSQVNTQRVLGAQGGDIFKPFPYIISGMLHLCVLQSFNLVIPVRLEILDKPLQNSLQQAALCRPNVPGSRPRCYEVTKSALYKPDVWFDPPCRQVSVTPLRREFVLRSKVPHCECFKGCQEQKHHNTKSCVLHPISPGLPTLSWSNFEYFEACSSVLRLKGMM